MDLREAVERLKSRGVGHTYLTGKDNEALRTLIEHAGELEDAAMLIKRMAYKLNKMYPDGKDPIASKALNWLKRKGLQGSVLRKESDDVSS